MARNQGGLLDVELHPAFERNAWIYMSYSKPDGESSMTATLRAQYDGAEHALTDIEEIYVGHPCTERVHHYGSRIVFDHDGYLYFSIGDRGEKIGRASCRERVAGELVAAMIINEDSVTLWSGG